MERCLNKQDNKLKTLRDMKRLILVLLAVTAVFGGNKVSAQGKYGADSAECIKYLSYYTEYYKQKNYDSALPNWRKAYSLCPPTASQNMFIHGTSLITRVIGRTSNAEYRNALIDTLLTLQDTRLQYYPAKKVDILNNKGQYIINYKGNDAEFLHESLDDIVEELGGKAKASILIYDLQSAIDLYRNEKLDADKVIEVYETVIGCAEQAPDDTDEAAEAKSKLIGDIQGLFADSKVASCENLVEIFTPRFEENPNDISLVTNIVKLMNSADCLSEDLYLKAVTSMHKNDPGYKSAYFLYKLHSSKKNVDEAVKYLEEALSMEGSTAEERAAYYYELANYCLNNGKKAKAYDAARKAADLGHGFTGKAYFLMGTIWGSTSCGGNEITSRAHYWVAVDYLQKAKAADPTLTEDANRLIGSYSAYYPQTAEAFMYNLTNGQSYTVSCGGMTATTTVRTSN